MPTCVQWPVARGPPWSGGVSRCPGGGVVSACERPGADTPSGGHCVYSAGRRAPAAVRAASTQSQRVAGSAAKMWYSRELDQFALMQQIEKIYGLRW